LRITWFLDCIPPLIYDKGNFSDINVNKNPTSCNNMQSDLFTAKSLYMFRVSQHPSPGVLKTVTAASGTGHNIGTATSLQRVSAYASVKGLF